LLEYYTTTRTTLVPALLVQHYLSALLVVLLVLVIILPRLWEVADGGGGKDGNRHRGRKTARSHLVLRAAVLRCRSAVSRRRLTPLSPPT
jgi:hypothetical protein